MVFYKQNMFFYTHVINKWLLFNIGLIAISCLPHWPQPFVAWISSSLYFLSFLLCVYIARKDKFNRDKFIPFVLYFAILSIYVLIFLTGDSFPIGDATFSWLLHKYICLSLLFFFAYSTVYFSAKSALNPRYPIILNIGTILFVSGIFLWHFSDVLFQIFL